MKQLQNNFTTPEQSKRLMEIGVPADSADCTMNPSDHNEVFKWHNRYPISEFVGYANERFGKERYCYCWSVGRLLEIIGACAKPAPCEIKIPTSNTIEYLLDIFDTIADGKGFDFSKLEE